MQKTENRKRKKHSLLRIAKDKTNRNPPQTGKFGDATDYNVFLLNRNQTMIGYALGFAAVFFTVWIFYNSMAAGLILGAAAGFAGIPLYRKYLRNKRKNALIIQFRDLLESLTTSMRTGSNTRNAFADAESDLTVQYGSDSDIVREVRTILLGVANGYHEEEMLQDFAQRSGLEDIRTFAMIFAATKNEGSDISQILDRTHEIISQKISIEMEIQTTITETKNQMNIMMIMPFVIVLMLRYMGNADIVNNSPINLVTKTVALAIFALSYWIGRKIADIRV